jgi:hypothetical protein
MTVLLHRLSALLLLLSLVAGGWPAQAMHVPAPVAPGPEHAAVADGDAMHGCHDSAPMAMPLEQDPHRAPADCCDHHGGGDADACDLACACPPAVAAPAPVPAATAGFADAVPVATPAHGDPGYMPSPPRRPPIA